MCIPRPLRFGGWVLVSALLALEAACGGASSTTSGTTSAPTLQTISITPSTAQAPAGATLSLVATGLYSDHSTQDLTAAATWSSSDPHVGVVSNAAGSRGLTTAVGAGSATIAATVGGASGSTTLEVTVAARQWAWMSGASGANAAAVYGLQGVPAAANVPGARQGAAAWSDSAGRLWLFGGTGLDAYGNSDYLNDLWVYDPSTQQWTWTSGANTVDAYGGGVPGARENAVAWTDASGSLWLFGGFGYADDGSSGDLGDLWRYDPPSGNWTWVGGTRQRNAPGIYGVRGTAAAANRPGARFLASGWSDAAGHFWLFGGYGYDAGSSAATLGDLWTFDPATLQWCWMGGSSSNDAIPVFGTEGVPAAANGPGARYQAAAWVDITGDFWLLGGYGTDADERFGYLNDLWNFTPSSGSWVWAAGADLVTSPGTYGTVGQPTPSTSPGARQDPLTWRDAAGRLWLFGGQGYDALGSFGVLNDLWMYDPDARQWTWEGGTSFANAPGLYGALGTPAAASVPGARYESVAWTDAAGHFWLFGGFGQDAAGSTGLLNDLWKY
jgi:N-acetylneuraminic acid mutarotase